MMKDKLCRRGSIVMLAIGLAATAARAESPSDKEWLLALDEPAASAATTAKAEPATQPAATAAAEPEASSSWPPGLLMDGMSAIGAKDAMDALGIRMWGFVETSFTGNLTNGDKTLFGRVFDARRVNNLNLNQTRLTIERPYDATKPFDFGFRFDALYGGDAMLTHSPGLFDHLGSGDGSNWADLVQGYGQLWFKTGEESGLEITGGKFATTLGAEVIDATGNALFSHSYLFGYAIPFTHTGVKANYIINSHASVYVAAVEGWEVFHDNNNAWSYMAGGAFTGTDEIDGHARDTLYVNFITGPEESDNTRNFRTVIDATLIHWWTEKLSSTINGDFGTESDAAPDGGQANWYGVAHYLTYTFNDYVAGTWRTEWFADDSGARIGTAGNYYENTFGLNLTPWPDHAVLKNLSFRPELRWDHSNEAVFGHSSERDEMTAAMDVIFKF